MQNTNTNNNVNTNNNKTITSKVLSERAVLLHVSICGWLGKRSDEDARDTIVQAFGVQNADRIEAKKSLVDPELLKGVKNAAQKAREWHYKHSLPWLDGGLRLIGAAKLDEHCAKLREFRAEWEKEVATLKGKIGPALEEGKKALSGLGKDEDFPSADEVIEKFKFGFSLVPVPDKRDIRVELSAEGLAAAEESVNTLVKESSKNGVLEIKNRVAKVVGKIIEKLGEKREKLVDGKKVTTEEYAIFRDSLIENALEIVPLIRELNVLDDPEVDELASNLERQLRTVEPDRIREDETYRKEVVQKATSVLETMQLSGFGE